MGDPIKFINKMFEHNSLILRTIPYDSGPVTAVFDIRGLREEAIKYKDDLNWFD